MTEKTTALSILASINTGDIAAYAANEVIKCLEGDYAALRLQRDAISKVREADRKEIITSILNVVLDHPIASAARLAVKVFPGVEEVSQQVTCAMPHANEQVPNAGIAHAAQDRSGVRVESVDALYQWLDYDECIKLFFYVDTYGMARNGNYMSAVGRFPSAIVPLSTVGIPEEIQANICAYRVQYAAYMDVCRDMAAIENKLKDPVRIQREAHAELVRRALLESDDATLLRIAGVSRIVESAPASGEEDSDLTNDDLGV